MDKRERLRWIDFIKGIAILSVVYLHVFNGYSIQKNMANFYILKYITSFHMALFFSCSGYFFVYDKKNYTTRIKKKFKQLMIPYFIWGIIIGFFLENIRIIIRNYKIHLSSLLLKIVTLRESYLACWFLSALFGVYLLEYFLTYINSKIKLNNKVLLFIEHSILLVIGYLLSLNFIGQYLQISIIFISSFFFYIGYMYKNREITFGFKSGILFILIGLCLAIINQKVTYSSLSFANPVISLCSAICSIIGIFIFCEQMYKCNFFQENWLSDTVEYFGKNSIIILILHPIGLYGIRIVEKVFNMEIHTFPGISAFVIVSLFCAIVIKILPKKFLKYFGK